ncbi:MAG: AI-2E family transporter [Akkermansiaceae bacterium]|nr:AI-2E family transporter [Armatimonadota bacterium]
MATTAKTDYDALKTPSPLRPDTDNLPPNTVRHVIADYPRIILFAVAVFLFLRFFESISQALFLFLFAILLAIVLNAPVRFLEARGVKRGISVAGVALILLTGIGTTLYIAGPRIAQEAVTLVQKGPERAARVRDNVIRQTQNYPQVAEFIEKNGSTFNSESLAKNATALLPRIGRYTLGFFGALATGFFLFVLTLYMVAQPKPLIKGLLSAVPPAYRKEAAHALTRIVGQLEAWALATLVLMVIIGVMSGVGLALLGVPNALLFGLIAGFGEAIPTIGPILSAVPPFAVAVADDPAKGGQVLVLFLVVQQLENNLLVPWIMSRNLNLHPVSILFFVVSLGSLLGVAGALLAVPTAIIVKILWEEFYLRKRAPREDALDAAADAVLRAGERTRPARRVVPDAVETKEQDKI